MDPRSSNIAVLANCRCTFVQAGVFHYLIFLRKCGIRIELSE